MAETTRKSEDAQRCPACKGTGKLLLFSAHRKPRMDRCLWCEGTGRFADEAPSAARWLLTLRLLLCCVQDTAAYIDILRSGGIGEDDRRLAELERDVQAALKRADTTWPEPQAVERLVRVNAELEQVNVLPTTQLIGLAEFLEDDAKVQEENSHRKRLGALMAQASRTTAQLLRALIKARRERG